MGSPEPVLLKKTWNVEPGSKNRYTYYAFLTFTDNIKNSNIHE